MTISHLVGRKPGAAPGEQVSRTGSDLAAIAAQHNGRVDELPHDDVGHAEHCHLACIESIQGLCQHATRVADRS